MLSETVKQLFDADVSGGNVRVTTEPPDLGNGAYSRNNFSEFQAGIIGSELIQLDDAIISLSGTPGNFRESRLYSAQLAHMDSFYTNLHLLNANTWYVYGSLNDRFTARMRAIDEQGAELASLEERIVKIGESFEESTSRIFMELPDKSVGSLDISTQRPGTEDVDGRMPAALCSWQECCYS